MSAPKALIVDDEADIRALLDITLSRMGLETCAAANLEEAFRLLETERDFALCLTDMRLPDGLGIELVRRIHKEHPNLPVAVITAYGNAEDAVNSLKSGAFDFVTKPVNIETLRRLVESALRMRGTKAVNEPTNAPDAPQLTGNTPAIVALRNMISKLARNQAPVHICGESGTGKELAAKMIHAQGPRAESPFVPVNCGAVPSDLMESEFFGHVKGSFTGAVADRPGLFRSAEGGTLFLDEVGDLPLAMQVKLLRAIQERRIRPVGAAQEIPVDVRIISATHKHLQDMVTQGKFREDLYYRLNVIEMQVPALRERRDDIPALITELLQRIAQCHGKKHPPELSTEGLHTLLQYDFPGNIRELENILERAVALSENDCISDIDLGISRRHQLEPVGSLAEPTHALASPTANIDESLAANERDRIAAALQSTRYNKTKAAQLLGISFRSLRYRLRKLGMD